MMGRGLSEQSSGVGMPRSRARKEKECLIGLQFGSALRLWLKSFQQMV
jgi:hypothetical protein